MKSFSLIITLSFALGFLASCKKKCDCDAPDQLEATWHMTRVSGGLAGIDFTYGIGEVVWVFQEANSTLVVTNNLDSTDIKNDYTKFETGTYSYTTSTANGTNTLFVDGVAVGEYSFVNNKMLLDDGVASDGFLTEFER